MTQPQAIFAGLAMIALAILAQDAIRPSPALASGTGPFQLMNHSNTSSNVGIFRMDTTSGEVSFCYLTSSNDVNCTKYAR